MLESKRIIHEASFNLCMETVGSALPGDGGVSPGTVSSGFGY
jgi:hypothetical protein